MNDEKLQTAIWYLKHEEKSYEKITNFKKKIGKF